jgi:hypothetical protein
MKGYVLTAIAIASITLAALLASTARAQNPQRLIVAGPQVVIVNGGYGGYGYGPGAYGYGAYGGYGGYAAPYYPPSAPYGAGYSGGWQPYQQMYYQRLYYGLGF